MKEVKNNSDNIYADQLKLRAIRHGLVGNSLVNHHEFNIGKTGSSLSEEDQLKITRGEHPKYVKALNKLKTEVI